MVAVVGPRTVDAYEAFHLTFDPDIQIWLRTNHWLRNENKNTESM